MAVSPIYFLIVVFLVKRILTRNAMIVMQESYNGAKEANIASACSNKYREELPIGVVCGIALI